MTEASKARKRHPMRIVHVSGPPMDPARRAEILRALAEMGCAVLPPEASFEIDYPKRPLRSKPPLSVPVPVSCRAGVGGRRGRKRERARERRGPPPQYRMIETSGKAFELYESLRREAMGLL